MILSAFIFHFLTSLLATCFTFSNVSVIVALKSKFCRILGRALKIIFNCWSQEVILNHIWIRLQKSTEKLCMVWSHFMQWMSSWTPSISEDKIYHRNNFALFQTLHILWDLSNIYYVTIFQIDKQCSCTVLFHIRSSGLYDCICHDFCS
jgi:hypothetical protein